MCIRDRDEQLRTAGLEVLGDVLHEVVVDAKIGERPADGAGGRTDGHADDGHHEDHADQQTPEAPACRPGGSQVHRLNQLDLAVRLLDRDDRIFQLDQVLLLQLGQLELGFLGLRFRVVTNNHQCCHLFLRLCKVTR